MCVWLGLTSNGTLFITSFRVHNVKSSPRLYPFLPISLPSLLLPFLSLLLSIHSSIQRHEVALISKTMSGFRAKSKGRTAVVGGGVSGIGCLWGLRGTERSSPI